MDSGDSLDSSKSDILSHKSISALDPIDLESEVTVGELDLFEKLSPRSPVSVRQHLLIRS